MSKQKVVHKIVEYIVLVLTNMVAFVLGLIGISLVKKISLPIEQSLVLQTVIFIIAIIIPNWWMSKIYLDNYAEKVVHEIVEVKKR